MNMTNPAKFLTLAAMLALGLVLLCTAAQPAQAWLANYTYMQNCTITSPYDGALTNYQVPFLIYPQVGQSAGNTIYLQSKMWNFSYLTDLRVTDGNDNELKFWRENGDWESSKIWVIVPSVPAAPSTTEVRFYYSNGAAGVNCASNGTATFPKFFDDFSTNTIGTTWTVRQESCWNFSISGGWLSANLVGDPNDDMWVSTTNGITFTNLSIHYCIVNEGIGWHFQGITDYVWNKCNPSNQNVYRLDSGTDYVQTLYRNVTGTDGSITQLGADTGTGQSDSIVEWRSSANRTGLFVSPGYTWNYTVTDANASRMAGSSVHPGFGLVTSGNGADNGVAVDYIFAREYTNFEPTVTSWGAEALNSSYYTAPSYVTIVLHSGYSIVYPGGTIEVLGGETKAAGSDGAAMFQMNYGRNYTVNYTVTSGSTTKSGQVCITPTEARYWIDVDTGAVVPDSVASLGLSKTHECTLTVYDWWNPIPNVNVSLYYPEDNKVVSKITDNQGQATFGSITDVRYKVTIVNSTLGIDYTGYYYMPKDSLVIRVYPVTFDTFLGSTGIHLIGGIGNFSVVQNPTGFSPQSVHANAYAIPGDTNQIMCLYNDTSGYTTSVTYELYTWNIGDNNSTTLLSTQTISSCNSTAAFDVDDPYGRNYEVWITGHQTGGDVHRYYDYTWPGPMWRLPGVPVGLYQWICVAVIMAVLLGCAKWSDIGMAGIMCAITTAGLWMSGWMFAWGNAIPPIITFVFVLSTIMYWNQRQRMEG